MELWCYGCAVPRTVSRLPEGSEEEGAPMAWACVACGRQFTPDRRTWVFGRLTPQPGDQAPGPGDGGGAGVREPRRPRTPSGRNRAAHDDNR